MKRKPPGKTSGKFFPDPDPYPESNNGRNFQRFSSDRRFPSFAAFELFSGVTVEVEGGSGVRGGVGGNDGRVEGNPSWPENKR